jgi:hypothetical protein
MNMTDHSAARGIPADIRQALKHIVALYLTDEERDSEAYDQAPYNHIVHSLRIVRDWIEAAEFPFDKC